MATFPLGHWTAKTTSHNNAVIRAATRNTAPTSPGKVTWITDPSDTLTLRGIPAIGRGVAGQIPGTRPDIRSL